MANSHHSVRKAIRRRLESGEWALGDRIPGEVALAEEYGCARTTINRALQTLAQEGLLVRKRKGGTRVCQLPVRQAKFDIPVVREQIESRGAGYQHQVLNKGLKRGSAEIRSKLNLKNASQVFYIETLHLADRQPYCFEERWINPSAVPDFETAPFDSISMNEWLVKTVPFSSGDVEFYAVNASEPVAEALKCQKDAALFVVDRTTWFNQQFVTTVKLHYQPGYQLRTQL